MSQLILDGDRAARRARLTAEAWLAAFAILLVLATLVSLGMGRLQIPVLEVVRILTARLLPMQADSTPLNQSIVLLVRAPRILMAVMGGAALAMAGASLQGVFRNPLVAPQTLGISGGAAFGGALAILTGQSGVLLVGSAFLFGMVALLLVGLLSKVDGKAGILTVVLSGIVIEAMFGALVSLLEYLADPNSSLPAIIAWLMGTFATITWPRLGLAAVPVLIGMVGLFLLRFRVNILSLGEDDARSFGVRVEFERWLIFVLVALVTGGVIAVAGIVGWVALVVPHAARLIVGPDHRVLVPASALLGGAFLVVVDTLCRSATAAEIPLGVLTAVIGAPIFALLLRAFFVGEGRA